MRSLFKKFKDWRSQKLNPSPERWEQIRAQGQARYVIHEALVLVVTVSVATDLIDYLWDAGNSISHLRSTILIYSITGLIAGSTSWSTHESKYKKALASRRQLFSDNKIVLR